MDNTAPEQAQTATENFPPRGLQAGAFVLVVLHSPREKCWGSLADITAAGVTLRGLDVNAFDDWMRAVTRGEGYPAPLDMFLPLWRVERMTRDESLPDMPSMSEQFHERTGYHPQDCLYSTN